MGQQNDKWVRIVSWVLLLNFVNLSANFYMPTASDSIYETHADPIDSISELILEYALDMEQDTIPDTEVPEQKRKIKDFKIFYHAVGLQVPSWVYEPNLEKESDAHCTADKVDLAKNSPPPKIYFLTLS